VRVAGGELGPPVGFGQFSNRPHTAGRGYEHETPHPLSRAKAAAKVRAAGYYVTLRLDPMIPIGGWEEAYTVRFSGAAGSISRPVFRKKFMNP